MLAIRFVRAVPWSDLVAFVTLVILTFGFIYAIRYAIDKAIAWREKNPPAPPTIQELADTSDFKFL